MINFEKIIKSLILCLILSFVAEIVIFNFKSIRSMGCKKVKLDNISTSNNVKISGKVYTINNPKNDFIEIKNINKEINNVKLDLEILNGSNYIDYNIYATDEANELYFKLPERHYYPSISQSKYITLNLSGPTNKLKIQFNDRENKKIIFKINEISINNKIPIDISFTRLILLCMLIFIIYYVRPNSDLYKYKINFKSKKQLMIIVIVMIVEALGFYYILNSNKITKNFIGYSNHFQYQQLAKSLSKGKTYLEITPSEEIKNMKNPYDFNYRKKLTEENGSAFEWDRAYYKGKYYVYFGVVPVVTMYLPYYLLTNKDLPNYAVIYMLSILIMIGIFVLLKEVTKRYFKKIPFLLFLLVFVWLLNCLGLIGILCYPTLYNIPITFALTLTIFGLYFWISSLNEKQISKIRIFIGSLCMALVAGCRPQLLIGSFFAIPIFWNSIFKERKLFSKNSIYQTIYAIIPYIVIAAGLMYYNKIRFGSIVDFGANYNITGNDMTRRGFKLDRIGLGLFSYLFQPYNLNASFPFLTKINFNTNYMGTTISEPMFGGILLSNSVLLFGMLFFRFKKIINNKKLMIISGISIIGGLLLIILDTQMAGILQRYTSDFIWLFSIPTVIVIMSIFNSEIFTTKIKKIILEIIIILMIASMAYQFLYIFEDQFLHDMINSSTEFYFKWYYLLQWWI